MSLNGDAPENAVAYLTFHRSDKPSAYHDFPIAANAQFDVGRAEVQHALGLHEQSISNQLLRFHCVIYGDDESEGVPPLVYVRVLSSRMVTLIHTSSTGVASTTLLNRDHPDVLLTSGDFLKLTKLVTIEYDANYEGEEAPILDSVQQSETKRFAQQYIVTPRKLGSGGFASVHLGLEAASTRQVACKIVRLPENPATDGRQALQHRLKEATKDIMAEQARHRKRCLDLRRECEILKSLDHPNIIRLEKAFYATEYVYIFQELVTGGDLLSYLEKKRGVPEPEAMTIVFQLLKALEYLHSRGIVHRDVKPENVLMTSWREGARVVLTDFGQSRTIQDAKIAAKGSDLVARMSTVVGTPGYTAPEVYQQLRKDIQKEIGYSKAIDIWSIGCLAGALFTNQLLFPTASNGGPYAAPDSDSEETAQHFNLGFLDSRAEWKEITNKAKSFVRACVVVDEAKRLTAKQALLHRWLTNSGYSAELQALYGRATADWKPRVASYNLIEYLKTPTTTSTKQATSYDARLYQEVKSRHFAACVPPVPQLTQPGAAPAAARQRHTPLSPIEPPPTKADATTASRRVLEVESRWMMQQYAPPSAIPPFNARSDQTTLPSTSTKRVTSGADLSWTQDSLPLPPIEYVPRKKMRA